jgi:hypothetical protein
LIALQVVSCDCFLEGVKEVDGPFLGVGEMVGEISLLLEFKTEVQLVLSVRLHPPHRRQLYLLVLDHLLPALPYLPPHADPVVLLKLLILHGFRDTLAKYSRIFMRRTTTWRSTSEEAARLKWKKVFEDGLMEYCAFMGSRAGVRIRRPSNSSTFYRLPESKLELILMAVPPTSSEKSRCRDYITIY